MKWFAIMLAVSFVLRIFYSGLLCQDDGFWFTTAEEVLRGKALYREVYFDKPPVLPLIYGSLFWLFGAHILVIRLFTIFYSLAVSAVLYLFGSRLYDRRVGILAAALFTFFSTTSVNTHEQGLNTDMLMTLPYTASAFFLMRACFERRPSLALMGGALCAIAVQTNPKGIFDLIFFAALLVVARKWTPGSRPEVSSSSTSSIVLGTVAGFALGTAPFIVYLGATKSLSYYWLDVWEWGSKYAGYFPARTILTQGGWLTVVFFVRNNTLLIGFGFVTFLLARSISARLKHREVSTPGHDDVADSRSAGRSDITALLWFAASYAALVIGGRFYSNYFFQILPCLSIIAGRGLIGIYSSLKRSNKLVRQIALAVILIGFAITVVRNHGRTFQLALDFARGSRSDAPGDWHRDKLNQEQIVAAAVRGVPYTTDTASPMRAEALRADSPRTHGAASAADYLFVWGARAEIYYWSGLIPASRYLSTQPLTGVPADVHHVGSSPPIIDDAITAAARAQLLRDLEQTQPRYIVDEIAFYNHQLSIQNYPELSEFLSGYKNLGREGNFILYRKREGHKKDRRSP